MPPPGTRLPFLYPGLVLSKPHALRAAGDFALSRFIKRELSCGASSSCVFRARRTARAACPAPHRLHYRQPQQQQCRTVTVTRHGTAVPRDLGTGDAKFGGESSEAQSQSQTSPSEASSGDKPVQAAAHSGSDSSTAAESSQAASPPPSVVNHFIDKQQPPISEDDNQTLPSSSSSSLGTVPPRGGGGDGGGDDGSTEESWGLYYHHNPNRYYHNFDTYVMTKSMADAGFPPNQAKAVTKTIRDLLVHHIGVAKEDHVSKSMTENENYLFRAACSELRTEVQNSRKAMFDKTRLERAQLQHDYDQLQQSFSDDLLNLKDEVSSLFNDRKMVTRAEQRAMEVKIQELNYKLTVLLSGDLRSEIESLRWVTTRRSLIALLTLAAVIITFIRFSGVGSQIVHEHEHEHEHPNGDFASEQPHRASTAEELAAQKVSGRDNDGSDGGLVSLG